MISRKPFVVLPLFLLVLTLVIACSPETKHLFKVGVLNPLSILQPVVDGFKDGMKELGYTDENVTYVTVDNVQDTPEGLKAAAETLVKQDVNVIMTVTNGAAEAAMQATTTIPIVAGLVVDPVKLGYAKSETEPGSNFTGIDVGPAGPRRLQLFTQMFPDVKKIYVPLQAGYGPALSTVESIRPLAEELSIELVVVELSTAEEVLQAVADAPADIDAIFAVPDILVSGEHLGDFAKLAIERGIPLTHMNRQQQGPVLVLGANMVENGKQAARLADQILDGANVSKLPIEVGESYIAIDLWVAEQAKLTVPEAFLAQADQIIRTQDGS